MTTAVSHGHATAETLFPPPNLDVGVVTIGGEAGAKAGGSWGPLEENMTAMMAWIGLRIGRAAVRPYPRSKLDVESVMAGEVGSASLVLRLLLPTFLLGCALSATYPTLGVRGGAEVVWCGRPQYKVPSHPSHPSLEQALGTLTWARGALRLEVIGNARSATLTTLRQSLSASTVNLCGPIINGTRSSR
jgi:hypothetical protein